MADIQVTGEMVELFKPNHDPVNELESPDIRSGLAAVLAVVARDYRLHRICREELMPGVNCARPAHIRGDHEAAMPNGSQVTWS